MRKFKTKISSQSGIDCRFCASRIVPFRISLEKSNLDECDSYPSKSRSIRKINELSKSTCQAGESSQVNRAADPDSALAHNLHLLFVVCAAHSRSCSSVIKRGPMDLESMGKPSMSLPARSREVGVLVRTETCRTCGL